MDGKHHDPGALPPGKIRYLFYRRLGGPEGGSGRVLKILTPPGFDPRTVQSVANLYIDCAIPAHKYVRKLLYSTFFPASVSSRLV